MTVRDPHIAIDARMSGDGGIGTYLQALVPRVARLRPNWRFTMLGARPAMAEYGWHNLPNATLVDCRASIFSIREQLELPLRVPSSADLYWAPNYNVPMFLGVPFVVTIHDVNHLVLPELLGGQIRRTYARLLLTSAVGRARRIVFVSAFTQRETARVLGPSHAEGTVVHSAVEPYWHEARTDAPERPVACPYFLYVGNIKRHKNVPMLLRSFARIMDRIPHRLVLIGRGEGLRADPEVDRVLPSLGDRAIRLGEVSPATVRRYVAHAEALVTVSLYEGFGLPPLEAMAAGCPCIVSNAGSLPEVCGDAARYCDPRDESSVSRALLEIANDAGLRRTLAARGREHVARFNWDRAAHQTAVVLEQALAK